MNLPVSLKTIANVLGIVLLIALVAPFVVYAVPGVVGAEHSFVVLTASMTPAIAPGDVVIVDERDPAAIADSDVITFVRGGNEVPVTHRVIDVVDGPGGVAFETQGDANGAPDASLVPSENVLGVVMLTIPYIGYVIQFTDSPLGFAALVVVPFGLLLLSELWSFARNRRGDATAGAPADDDRIGSTGTAATATAAETDDSPVLDPDSNTATGAALVDDAAASTDSAELTPSGSTGVTVDTVIGAGAVLAVFAPYSAYVAFQSPTALAVTVAIATTALLLAALAMWVPTTGLLDRSGSDSSATAGADLNATDGVVDAPTADASAADRDAAGERDASDERPPLATDGAGEGD